MGVPPRTRSSGWSRRFSAWLSCRRPTRPPPRQVPDLQLAIPQSDEAVLTSVSGVGKKLAGRVILELKEKVAAAGMAAAAAPGAGRGGERAGVRVGVEMHEI